jgi:hypothetical protein
MLISKPQIDVFTSFVYNWRQQAPVTSLSDNWSTIAGKLKLLYLYLNILVWNLKDQNI